MSATSTLESYFYLSCHDGGSPDTRQITLPCQRGPSFEGIKKRVMEVANALAFICVKESHAIRLRFSGEGQPAVVHVAENNGVTPETKLYFEDVLSQLTALSQEQPRCQATEESLDFDSTINQPQRNNSWTNRIRDIRSKIISSETDEALFGKIEGTLGTIHQLASKYHTKGNKTTLCNIFGLLDLLDELVRRSESMDKIADLLRRIDFNTTNPYTPTEDSHENDDDDPDVDIQGSLKPGLPSRVSVDDFWPILLLKDSR
ncbi:hypothetical protein CPB83DRAFT_907643 [Crepidotus variabilis]|uniref:Uncharacterized protein n=1 Tax=Crepidotus variabilis TaxID=179855 RepID=A0A9P6EED6_9AGAR|nr:hypothetical protein CPB83DRAFT_907643 [Crepidotus variabilis]